MVHDTQSTVYSIRYVVGDVRHDVWCMTYDISYFYVHDVCKLRTVYAV